MLRTKTQWRSFADARRFVRKLKLRSTKDWSAYVRGQIQSKHGSLPPDIPSNPALEYAFEGWEGFDDWLGTGRKSPTLPPPITRFEGRRGKRPHAPYVRDPKLARIIKQVRAGLDDELWTRLLPALAKCPARRETRGRGRFTERDHLVGVLAIAKSGLPWQRFPSRFGLGHGLTCQNRFKQWHYAGAWEIMEPILKARFPEIPQQNWDYLHWSISRPL